MTEPTALERPGRDLGLTIRSLLSADAAVLLRTRQSLLLNFLVPLVFIVVTGFGVQSRQQVFSDPGILIGLSITYGLLSSGMLGYSIAVARDRDNGVFERLRVTPTPTWAIMGSRIVVQLAVNLVMAIVVLVIGSVLHDVAYQWYQYVAMLGVSVLGAAVFIGIGQAVVGLVKSSAAVNGVGRVLYVLLLLSGLLGTTGLLGSGFQTFSEWTPVGALTSLFAAALGAPYSAEVTYGLIASLVYIGVFAFIGIRWFRWESR